MTPRPSATPMDEDARMTFTEHLEELRNRLSKALVAVALGMMVGWHFREQIFAWLLRPLTVAWYCQYTRSCNPQKVFHWMSHPEAFQRAYDAVRAAAARSPNSAFPVDAQVHFADPTSSFVVYFKVAALGGLLVALPVVFYQLWAFIAPGLYPRERRLILPFVFFSTLFFLAGVMFGYYFVFPVGYEFLLGFSGPVAGTSVKVVPTLMMDDVLGFTTHMILAFGVVFELPLFVFFLSLAGLVTWKQLLKFARYFTVIAFVLAAILTPSTDMFSQIMLALPLIALYFLAVLLAYLFGPKQARKWRFASESPAAPPGAKKPTRVEKARTRGGD